MGFYFVPVLISAKMAVGAGEASAPSISSIISVVTSLVEAAITWVEKFVTLISSQPLLLMFVVVAFVGLAVGLIRRLIRL